ncbi:MAG TPA: hypothetical protein VGI05_23570 [Streptosporangiaceae bacterium]
MSMQAEPGGLGSGLASGAAPPRFALILALAQVVAAISRHRAE